MSHTILLVDDDPVVKMTLRSLLAGHERTFSIAGAVSNGKEALHWLSAHRADIVITDLIMPTMPGLQLIEELKKADFPGAILVLSNYSDFALVRQALLLGAKDYLLKADLKTIDLQARLEALTKQLAIDSDQLKQQDAIDGKLQCAMIRDYLTSKSFPEAQLLDNSSIAATLASSPCTVCRLQSLPPLPPRTSVPIERLEGIVRSVYEDLEPFVLIRLGDTALTWLLPQPYLEETGRDIRLTLEMLKRQARLYFSLDLILAYGAPVCGMEAVKQSFKTLGGATDILFYGQGRILFGREVSFSPLPSNWNAQEFARELLADWEEGREAALQKDIEWRCDRCRKETVAPDAVRTFFFQSLDYIGFLRKVGRQRFFREDILLDDLAADFLKEVVRLLSGETTEAIRIYGKDVQTLLKYLDEHYTEQVSLDRIVEQIHLNKSYLCRLFKKETGMSIGSYVTKLRMEKACSLMDRGSRYIKEIAPLVGFEDPLYFTRVFTKTMGISPSQYLKNRS